MCCSVRDHGWVRAGVRKQLWVFESKFECVKSSTVSDSSKSVSACEQVVNEYARASVSVGACA